MQPKKSTHVGSSSTPRVSPPRSKAQSFAGAKPKHAAVNKTEPKKRSMMLKEPKKMPSNASSAAAAPPPEATATRNSDSGIRSHQDRVRRQIHQGDKIAQGILHKKENLLRQEVSTREMRQLHTLGKQQAANARYQEVGKNENKKRKKGGKREKGKRN